MKPIRVILADDHPAFRSGVRARLEAEKDMVVIEEVENGTDALEQTCKLIPDVLVLDMELPFLSGLEVARELNARNTPVQILPLSGFSGPEFVFGVLEAGAAGYLTKDESLQDIVNAIRRVVSGGVYISSKVAIEIVSREKRRSKAKSEAERAEVRFESLGITPTLLRILKLIGRGFSNADIADMVCRSEHTVRNHVDKLKGITEVRWRPALVAWSWKNGVMQMRTEDDEVEEAGSSL